MSLRKLVLLHKQSPHISYSQSQWCNLNNKQEQLFLNKDKEDVKGNSTFCLNHACFLVQRCVFIKDLLKQIGHSWIVSFFLALADSTKPKAAPEDRRFYDFGDDFSLSQAFLFILWVYSKESRHLWCSKSCYSSNKTLKREINF